MKRSVLILLGFVACAMPPASVDSGRLRALDPEALHADPSEPTSTYLSPNFVDVDGTPAFLHLTPEQMPFRIHVRRPFDRPRDGSPEEARRAVMEGFRLWQLELEPDLPWFELEFVDRPRDAALVVGWTTVMTSPEKATGTCEVKLGEGPEFECRLDLALGRHARLLSTTRPGGALGQLGGMSDPVELVDRQSVAQIMNLAAHEFGHVLGLGHCWCDSIMNYSSSDRPYPHIREIDRRTLLELVAIPNGMRTDGQIVELLRDR